MRVTEVFPEDARETVTKAVETVLAEGQSTIEVDLLTADGERIPYEFTGARPTDPDGQRTGLVGIGRNLTARRQREHRFQALVEESNDLISVIDADGVFEYQSPRSAYRRLYSVHPMAETATMIPIAAGIVFSEPVNDQPKIR